MTGCAEPHRRHCGGASRQHNEAVPTWRTPEAPSALSACPLAAQDEMEEKRPRSTRQDQCSRTLSVLEQARLEQARCGLLREIAANDEPKADLHALTSLLHNVRAQPTKPAELARVGCSEGLGVALKHSQVPSALL